MTMVEPRPTPVALAGDRPAWMDHAACRGANVSHWYPDTGDHATDAYTVCAGCPVKTECLDHAIDTGEQYGIWGGLNWKQRRRLPRKQRTVTPIAHGTIAGYSKHRRRHESACDACRAAAAVVHGQHTRPSRARNPRGN
jgi:WhiB family transcriptional regulator, redox-sensing transcriptional regulator